MYEDAIAVVVQASLQKLLHAVPELDCHDHPCSAVVKNESDERERTVSDIT